jgi:hypothetical protein
MIGRRASDWLACIPANGDERTGADRRASPVRRFDPLFAATLVNQIAAPEALQPRSYSRAPPRARSGFKVNLWA